MTPKSKSNSRFKQLNAIVDKLIRRLPKGHALVVIVAFRHADPDKFFSVSVKQFSETLAIHPRTARRILDDLILWGVVEVISERKGTIPRKLRLTGRAPSGGL